MNHKYLEIHRRIVNAGNGARGIEILFGCCCNSFGDVALASTLRLARQRGKAAVREHAAIVELDRAQAYRRLIA